MQMLTCLQCGKQVFSARELDNHRTAAHAWIGQDSPDSHPDPPTLRLTLDTDPIATDLDVTNAADWD